MPAINRKVVELFARAGADAWYTPQADDIAAAAPSARIVAAPKFKKETDIVDVWFESGSSHAAVLGHEPNLPWPADLYLEGGDQYRGWFHSSLLCAVGTRDASPYRMVATNGWTLDEQGRAMSKSLGNVVDPVDIADRLGAEIVRLWVASVDFREDVTCSEHLMQRVADNYRKIRNTFRYILGNLYDFDPQKDAVPFEKLEALDQYMLRQTVCDGEDVKRWYEEFAFHQIYQRVNQFCVVELSAFYFDVLKDRLYMSAPNSRDGARRRRQSGGSARRWCVAGADHELHLRRGLATPAQGQPRASSVHLTTFPVADVLGDSAVAAEDQKQQEDWAALLAVREEVLKSLEEARNQKLIGTSLEAQVQLTAADAVYSVLKRYADQFRYLFIVSAVTLVQGSGNGSGAVSVQVAKADGKKCERCWNYSIHVGEDKSYPTVCERCSAVLKEIGPGAA